MNTLWADYVASVVGGRTQMQVERETGIAQTTISRWRSSEGATKKPQPAQVARFAQVYGRNVIEAFVAAGLLTKEDAGRGISDDELSIVERVEVEGVITLAEPSVDDPKDS